MEPDIENMTISEYLEYEAAKERRLWDDFRSRRSPTNYNEDDDSKEEQEERMCDGDTFDNVVEPIHTTPPNDDYVAPATKSILDELLEEFGDEILNVTMVDDEANAKPCKVDRDIISPKSYEEASHTGLVGCYSDDEKVACDDGCCSKKKT
ncbi:hypothetical protein Tco_0941587 [Tanacetum coccineum]|uniref:Uncharacterized protein n=1 Tax=Tanacetum coccineum TaxID=301880 RepID=A0ABQ5DS14_9ASTR